MFRSTQYGMDNEQSKESEGESEGAEEEVELTPMQKCVALFAGQHGVAADRQVRAAGISLKRQNALIASDVWKRVHAGVIGLTGAADRWERKVMAAALAVKGAVACGRTAARVHGLDGYRKYPGIKIAVPRSARRVKIDGVKYTRLDLDDEDTTVVNGIPVTTVAVTLMQLASRGLNAGQPLDDALRRGHKPRHCARSSSVGRVRGARTERDARVVGRPCRPAAAEELVPASGQGRVHRGGNPFRG